MDDLKKFKFENLNEQALKEINNLSVEQLKDLKSEKGTLIIRNKKTNQKGQSNYSNLIVLDSLGIRKRFDVIGFEISKIKTEIPIEKTINPIIIESIVDDYVAPEIPLFNEGIKEEHESEEGIQFEDFGSEEPKKRGRKAKNK
jgi:hypothetical protein